MKILNLFAGIGGNRVLWDGHAVTAIENDPQVALIYSKRFPKDELIVADAYDYLVNHFEEYDVIWASPPCQTHSKLTRLRVGRRYLGKKSDTVKLPDLKLYSLILFLQESFRGDWVVENVMSYYKPLIPPTAIVGRHFIWSNKLISSVKFPGREYANRVEDIASMKQIPLELIQDYTGRKDQLLRNAVSKPVITHIMRFFNSNNARQLRLHFMEGKH